MTHRGRGGLPSFVSAIITVAWHMARLFVALSALLFLLSPWIDPPRFEVDVAVPVSFQLDRDTHRILESPPDVTHVHLENARGWLHFSPRSPADVATAAVLLGVLFALAAWVLGQLRALLQTVRAGTPFVAANAVRIRRIGYAVIAGELVRGLVVYAGSRSAMTDFAVEGLTLHSQPSLDVFALVAGLVILVIARVFREGTRLEEDQSLTV